MVLTRAANQPGPDGISGDRPGTPQDESADDIQDATNTTTAFVDQNQTYTSHPAHQVFLREFELNGAGDPVETGRLLGGEDGEGLATWAAVKAQARDLLGIVLRTPTCSTCPCWPRTRTATSSPATTATPQLVTAGRAASRAATAGTAIPANAVRTGHAFLDDIAHHAVPVGDIDPTDGPSQIVPLAPDSDPGTGDDSDRTTYDDEMLDAHFIAGDGRANENIGLTTVHHIFHSEHNRLRRTTSTS